MAQLLTLPPRMNTILMTQTKLGLITALGLVSSLSAIERPGEKKDDALPAEVLPQFDELKKAETPSSKKITWLGVRSEAVSEDLAWHLNIDSGVIARVVDPTSPAAAAGLKDRDIILKVGGRAVKSRDQVRAAVLARQPGEEVMLQVLRQGKQQELKVTLGEREVLPQLPSVRPLEDQLPGFAQIIPRGMNNDDLALLQRQLLKRVEDALKDGPGGAAGQMNLRLNDLLEGNLPDAKDFDFDLKTTGSFSLSDDQGTVEMTIQNNKRQVKVTDPDGNVVFEGPYSTEEEKKAAPENIRERIEKLGADSNNGNGLRFQFNLPAEPQKEDE